MSEQQGKRDLLKICSSFIGSIRPLFSDNGMKRISELQLDFDSVEVNFSIWIAINCSWQLEQSAETNDVIPVKQKVRFKPQFKYQK